MEDRVVLIKIRESIKNMAKIAAIETGITMQAWIESAIKVRLWEERYIDKPKCPNTVYHYNVSVGIEPDGNCGYCQKKEG